MSQSNDLVSYQALRPGLSLDSLLGVPSRASARGASPRIHLGSSAELDFRRKAWPYRILVGRRPPLGPMVEDKARDAVEAVLVGIYALAVVAEMVLLLFAKA